jgi:hypothetical protein
MANVSRPEWRGLTPGNTLVKTQDRHHISTICSPRGCMREDHQ